jgi:hypothetical protein
MRRAARVGLISASRVEDVDLGDLAVSHPEDGPGCIWHAPRLEAAKPVEARHVESAEILAACPNTHAGASVKATPPGFKALDPRRESIVEPVGDEKAAPEVQDDATAL